MYKIKKVINNNAVLITDPNNEQEMIFMGNGIGYNRHKGEMIEDIQDCKQYVMNTEGVNYQSLVDPIYLKRKIVLHKLGERLLKIKRVS